MTTDQRAEGAILGLMISLWRDQPHEAVRRSLRDRLTPDHFGGSTRRKIASVVLEHLRDGKPCDARQVAELLGEKHPEVFGELAECCDEEPPAVDVEFWMSRLLEAFARRGVRESAQRMLASLDGGDDMATLELEAAEATKAITRATEQSMCVHAASVAGEVFSDMEARFEAGGGILGRSTGLPDLDATLSGFVPGDLVILAARPSMGKTALVGQFATTVAGSGMPVLFATCEMTRQQLMQRMLASESRVPNSAIRSGNISEERWGDLAEATNRLSHMPIWFTDKHLTMAAIRARAEELHERKPLGMLVLDYLQLLDCGQRHRTVNRSEELGKITGALKALAIDLHVPVVCLSQLNRAVEGRTTKRPAMSDLRESGSIEQDADVVILLYREDYYKDGEKKQQSDTSDVELIVAKNRNGDTNTVRVVFHRSRLRFSSITNEKPPQQQSKSHWQDDSGE